MASISNIQKLAKILNLQNMSNPSFELKETDRSNLDYLEYVLNKEMQLRSEKQFSRYLRESKLPRQDLDISILNETVRWQIDKIKKVGFTDERNLVIIGSCKTKKTAIASHLGFSAIKKGLKVYYIKQDLLVDILMKKENDFKSSGVWNKLKKVDVIIIDEMFYTNLSDEEIKLLYKSLVFLNETRKLIFITNRSLSEWIHAANDKHLIQTFIDRILANTEILRTIK